jgi:hypothetical protein
MDHDLLMARTRRAYELGRLRAALGVAIYVVPMITTSLAWCGRPITTIVVGAALLIAAIVFAWRGGAYGRAVLPGLWAGAAPLVLPILVRGGGVCEMGGGRCVPWCLLGCFGGGLVAGVAIAWRSLRGARDTSLVAGAIIAGLAGSMGCVIAGAGGLAGLALGAIAGSIPVLALRR